AGNRIVRVCGQNNLSHRKSHSSRPESRDGIAQVSGRYDETRRDTTFSLVPNPGCCVIDSLWQQPAQVDAVGRQQSLLLCPLVICEGGFHDPLAVVEVTAHGKRAHVPAPASKLMLLSR